MGKYLAHGAYLNSNLHEHVYATTLNFKLASFLSRNCISLEDSFLPDREK